MYYFEPFFILRNSQANQDTLRFRATDLRRRAFNHFFRFLGILCNMNFLVERCSRKKPRKFICKTCKLATVSYPSLTRRQVIADYYRAVTTFTPYTSNFTSNGCFRLTLLSNIAFDIWMFWQGKITLTHNVYCNQNPNQIWTNTIRRYFMFTFLHFNTKKYENSLISHGIPFTYSHMNNIFLCLIFHRFFVFLLSTRFECVIIPLSYA